MEQQPSVHGIPGWESHPVGSLLKYDYQRWAEPGSSGCPQPAGGFDVVWVAAFSPLRELLALQGCQCGTCYPCDFAPLCFFFPTPLILRLLRGHFRVSLPPDVPPVGTESQNGLEGILKIM